MGVLGLVFWIWWGWYWPGYKGRIEKLEAQIKKLEKKNA